MPKSKKKGKASKKGKGKSKKCCDGQKLCEKLEIREKIEYLVDLGVLQNIDECEPIEFDEFIGDFNYIQSLQDSIDPLSYQPEPTLAQARNFAIEFGALPLGSTALREHTPVIPAILLYGPKGSGKTLLSHAIAHSTSARWFDLSPKVLLSENNRNETESVKDISKIIHITFDVAEYLGPSIIYVDEIESIFVPTKKKTTKSSSGGGASGAGVNPSKLKKDLMSHTSKINSSKRILVIGNSSSPYNDSVDRNDLKKMFSCVGTVPDGQDMTFMCYIPYPNYLSRMRLWTHFIQQISGIDIEQLNNCPKFELSILTLLSEGYTAGSIMECVRLCLTPRRIEKFKNNKMLFDTNEFFDTLSKTVYTYKDDHNAFREFTADVTNRDKQIAQIKAKLENPSSSGSDSKDKKKKGGKKKK